MDLYFLIICCKSEVDFPLYKTTLSNQMKKNIVRNIVVIKTISFAELFIKKFGYLHVLGLFVILYVLERCQSGLMYWS